MSSIPVTSSHPIDGGIGARILAWRPSLEQIAWGVLILLAILTRFIDLGYRAVHHDESLHTYFSWRLAIGEGYRHDPLMHGPFLFHANALIYKIFGASDATSRLLPAAFGVAMVAMPWLLRGSQFLGRWGALAAGYLLLISPSFLYYTRYIRHDPYMAAGCLLLTIAIFRYLERPQGRWIITAFVTVSFLLTNHELVLATFLGMVIFLWGVLLLTHLRPLIPVHAVALILLAVAAALWLSHPWPPIPWQQRPNAALTGGEAFQFVKVIGPTFIVFVAVLVLVAVIRRQYVLKVGLVVGGLVLGWGLLQLTKGSIPPLVDIATIPPDQKTSFLTTSQFYWLLVHHPFVQALAIIAAVFLIACAATISWMVEERAPGESALDALLGDAGPGSVAFGVREALRDPLSILVGIAGGLAFFVLLFTTFFTNPHGVATATYETNGTLLYWLGQHDVQRGEQPWFYFITLGLQYEWLGIALSLIGGVIACYYGVRWLFGRDQPRDALFLGFVAWWGFLSFAVLSWAGEKMPWLIMHIMLPAALVGGVVVNKVARSATRWYSEHPVRFSDVRRHGGILLVGALVLLAEGWFLAAAREAYGPPYTTGAAATYANWWEQAIPLVVALFLIAIATWLIGPRRAAYSTLVAFFAIFSLYQVHASYRMVYLEGDVAVDTMIYNTTSSDVNQFTHDMSAMSQLVYGDDSISILYDSCTMQWPLNWYLRDFPNAHFGSYGSASQPDVIVVHPNLSASCGFPMQIPGYTAQTYTLRWHEDEATAYRNFAIAPEIPVGRSAWKDSTAPHDPVAVVRSIVSSVQYASTPEGQQKLIRQLLYRNQQAPLIVYPMIVWVRDDRLPAYNEVRYGDLNP